MAAQPAWSYSSLTAFETCPKRYYLTRVSKEVTEPPTEATTHGNNVHKALEDRLKSKKPLSKSMDHYEKYCAKIESVPGTVYAEQKIALNNKFEQTGWVSGDCWVRMILDVTIDSGDKAVTLDWKTGKAKPESKQLALCAAGVMHTRPKVNEVRTGFIWLKDDKMTTETYTRDQLPEIWQEFVPRVKRLGYAYEENKWEAKPSGLCRAWCPVGKALCSFCGK
jgi:hypothetical protein